MKYKINGIYYLDGGVYREIFKVINTEQDVVAYETIFSTNNEEIRFSMFHLGGNRDQWSVMALKARDEVFKLIFGEK
jgi:hypothetical protein